MKTLCFELGNVTWLVTMKQCGRGDNIMINNTSLLLPGRNVISETKEENY